MFRRILIMALVALVAIAAPAAAQYDPGSGCGSVAISSPVSVDADGTVVAAAGSDASIALSNLLPGSTVTVTVGGLTVASYTVPASGELAGSFQLPASLADGTYTIIATGTHSDNVPCGASTTVRIGSTNTGGTTGSITVPDPVTVDTDGTPVVEVGDAINIVQNGLLPGSVVTVTLNGATLETVTVPASGEISVSVTVPTGTYAGDYSVATTGTNTDGSAYSGALDIRVASGSQAGATTTTTAAPTAGTTPAGSLAFTGSTAAPLAGAATVLIVLGAVMLNSRKPESSDS